MLLSATDEAHFLDDPTAQDAALYRLLVIGEATKGLSVEFRANHPAIAWAEIAGLRDIVAHSYHRISLSRIWATLVADIPELLAYVRPLLPDGLD